MTMFTNILITYHQFRIDRHNLLERRNQHNPALAMDHDVMASYHADRVIALRRAQRRAFR